MDALYILGTGSKADNTELRYSMRSLGMYMLDLRNIHISGHLPDFVGNVIHTPGADSHKQKWQNMLAKLRRACERDDLSEEFLLMNDDFFMLEPFNGCEYPFRFKKHVDGGASGPKAYTLHQPMRMHKKLVLEMPITPESSGNLSPRSFFGNFYGAGGSPDIDCIVVTGRNTRPIQEQIAGRDCFTIDDATMLDDEFLEFLQDLYPEQSRFEKSAPVPLFSI